MVEIRGFALQFAALTLSSVVHAQAPPAKQLTIERLALHQFEDGPVIDPSYEFVSGESIHFSCRMIGYRIIKTEEEQSVKLGWQMLVADPNNVPVEKLRAGRIEDKLSPQDKDWIPKFTASFVIPPFAPSGVYRVTVKIADEAAHSEISGELKFNVRGHAVQPSETLVTRNFLFLRSEDDRNGMRRAVYHPGETLWARFDITGYKYGAENMFSVEYGLAVLRESGEKLFEQPMAAGDSKQSFYPQRYVPGMLSLTLDQNVPKGSFILMVTVRDKVGNQTWETKQPFEIE